MSNEETPRRWPRVLGAVLASSVLLLTGAATAGVYYFQGVVSNIESGTDGNFASESFSATPGDPINIVLMGSDTRDGANSSGYGSASEIQGARSDTTILLHVSGDRQRAMGVSIPRDSLVQLADCKGHNGEVVAGRVTRFNEAFDVGGPGCSVKTLEELTGVNISHYLVVDFAGFKDIVNAVDGVEVCLKKPIKDKDARLDLPAGVQTVKGEDALAYVRARKALGDGSDISRIERQQEFLSSAIRKATSMGVVTNPAMLADVLTAGTKSLTADPGLANFDSIRALAINLSEVKPSQVTFATVPINYNDDGGTVSWQTANADELWSAIKSDTPWPPGPSNGTDGEPLQTPTSAITVNGINATGTPGEARRAVELLGGVGYNEGELTTDPSTSLSEIRYNPDVAAQVQAARTLQASTGVAIQPTSTSTGAAITLVVGTNYDFALQPVRVKVTKSAATDAAKPRVASGEVVCAG